MADARIDTVVDTVFGQQLADPYRWMEQDGPELHEWLDAQADTAARYLSGLPGRAELRARVAELSAAAVTASRFAMAGEQVFFLRQDSDAAVAVLMVRTGSDERVLLDPARFEELTRRPGVEKVVEGVLAAKAAGFDPVKVNAVAIKGVTEEDVVPLGRFAREHGLEMRFIEYMPLDAQNAWERDKAGRGTNSFKEWLKSNPPREEVEKYQFLPHVIEPSAGADRFTLAVLCEAYAEDTIGGEARTVMRFHPRLAPIKAAVLPLVNKDGMPEKAQALYRELKKHWNVFYDDAGVPVAEISVCFMCGMLSASPAIPNAKRADEGSGYGVSDDAIVTLRGLCNELGLPKCDARHPTDFGGR